jgi:actin-related protein 5
MSELLFECYQVPSVCYGVDSLFSYYGNRIHQSEFGLNDALIISSGFNTTHIIPILANSIIANKAKR